MYLEIFLADFTVFRVFLGISRKYQNFAGPRPREISEALNKLRFCMKMVFLSPNQEVYGGKIKESYLLF